MTESLDIRLTLIAAFYALGDVLAALAEQGDTRAMYWWDRMPSLPPVTRISDVADGLVLAREMLTANLGEAEPEAKAFCLAMWNFSQRAMLGEPPMRTFKRAIAATQLFGHVYTIKYVGVYPMVSRAEGKLDFSLRA